MTSVASLISLLTKSITQIVIFKFLIHLICLVPKEIQIEFSLTERTFFSKDAKFITNERLDPDSMFIKG